MAVYTHVSFEALTEFLKDYDLGEVLSFKGIAEGVENSNYLLHTTKGSFILTLYEKRVAERDLPFFLGLMQHLQTKGIACPLPVAATDGRLYRPLLGRAAAVISFLDGLSIQEPHASHASALGETLAGFHKAAEDFSIVRANGLGPKDWRPLFDSCRQKADEVSPGLVDLVDHALEDIESSWPTDLPTGVIHADLFPDNVFFLKDRLSGVIDFYFACNDVLAFDIAICLNAWCFNDALEFNPSMAQAITNAYSNVRPLAQIELDALPILCRGAALRFLLTRLHDWIFHPDGALVDPKDPKEFVTRLRFFSGIHSVKDLGVSIGVSI